MSCEHLKYKDNNYMMYENAIKAMGKGQICWISKMVTFCECGQDISKAKRVEVKEV